MINDMFKNTYFLQRSLDAAWMRNKAIANNIANVDTPGYKRQKVEFEQFLSEAIDNRSVRGYTTNGKHIPVGAGSIVDRSGIRIMEDNTTSMRLDGNNVDIESEMASLAKNNIMYDALIQKISGEFKKLRTAINEGRR